MHERSRSRWTAVAAMLLIAPVALFGCAADDEEPAETTPSSQPSETPTETGPTPEPDASGCLPAIPAGDASTAVADTVASGGVEAIETPVTADFPQVSIAGGDGEGAVEGDVVVFDFTVIDGSTGEALGGSTDGGGDPLVQQAGGQELASQMVLCAKDGSTVVLLATFGELYGDSAAQLGVDVDSTAVLVTTPVQRIETQATGETVAAPAQLPAVVLADDGTPSIEWGSAPTPTAIDFAPTIVGDGAVVEADDTVIVHYSLFEWGTDTLRDGSWGGPPAVFPLQSLLGGVQEALAGQTVGSQIVLALPSADGYQDGDLLFVFDILATVDR